MGLWLSREYRAHRGMSEFCLVESKELTGTERQKGRQSRSQL